VSVARDLASMLVRHAARAMPDREWAEAMTLEIRHIESDREAVSWAAGCVIAAYTAWARSEPFLIPWAARLVLAGWSLSMPLLFIYRASLFSLCPFFANPECQAASNPLPFALLSIGNCVFLLAGLVLIRNRRTAFQPYAAGFLIVMASHATMFIVRQSGVFQRLHGFYQSGSFQAAALPGEVLTVLLLPLMLGLAIWLVDRYPAGATETQN